MVYNPKFNEIVELFLITLTKRKKLPFKIPTNICPDKNKKCRLHHGEIVISTYDKKTKKFHLKYFGTHEKGVAMQYDQPIDFVKKIILRQINSKKKLISITKLKNKIDFSQSIKNKYQLNLHFSDLEWNKILRKSSKKNVSPYDYCRNKLLY